MGRVSLRRSNIGRCGIAGDPFPLTPTLSLGEREGFTAQKQERVPAVREFSQPMVSWSQRDERYLQAVVA